MIGIVAQCTYIARPHVQQMLGMCRAIGDAARQLVGPPLDQRRARAAMADQINGQQRARKAAADDRDMLDSCIHQPAHPFVIATTDALILSRPIFTQI